MKGKERLTGSQLGFLWSIVMPVIALFIIIRVIPVLVVLLMSFTNFNMNRPLVRFLPYQNFLRLFGDPNFVTAFVNSTEFVLVAVPVEILLGLALPSTLTGRSGSSRSLRPSISCLTSFPWFRLPSSGNGSTHQERMALPIISWT